MDARLEAAAVRAGSFPLLSEDSITTSRDRNRISQQWSRMSSLDSSTTSAFIKSDEAQLAKLGEKLNPYSSPSTRMDALRALLEMAGGGGADLVVASHAWKSGNDFVFLKERSTL